MFFENFDQNFYPWSFPSLLALVGVTIEKGLHWLPQATIATRLQRGVAPWSQSSAPARGGSGSDVGGGTKFRVLTNSLAVDSLVPSCNLSSVSLPIIFFMF